MLLYHHIKGCYLWIKERKGPAPYEPFYIPYATMESSRTPSTRSLDSSDSSTDDDSDSDTSTLVPSNQGTTDDEADDEPVIDFNDLDSRIPVDMRGPQWLETELGFTEDLNNVSVFLDEMIAVLNRINMHFKKYKRMAKIVYSRYGSPELTQAAEFMPRYNWCAENECQLDLLTDLLNQSELGRRDCLTKMQWELHDKCWLESRLGKRHKVIRAMNPIPSDNSGKCLHCKLNASAKQTEAIRCLVATIMFEELDSCNWLLIDCIKQMNAESIEIKKEIYGVRPSRHAIQMQNLDMRYEVFGEELERDVCNHLQEQFYRRGYDRYSNPNNIAESSRSLSQRRTQFERNSSKLFTTVPKTKFFKRNNAPSQEAFTYGNIPYRNLTSLNDFFSQDRIEKFYFEEMGSQFPPQHPLGIVRTSHYNIMEHDTLVINNKDVTGRKTIPKMFPIPPMPKSYKSISGLKAMTPELEQAIFHLADRIEYLHRSFPQYDGLKDRKHWTPEAIENCSDCEESYDDSLKMRKDYTVMRNHLIMSNLLMYFLRRCIENISD